MNVLIFAHISGILLTTVTKGFTGIASTEVPASGTKAFKGIASKELGRASPIGADERSKLVTRFRHTGRHGGKRFYQDDLAGTCLLPTKSAR